MKISVQCRLCKAPPGPPGRTAERAPWIRKTAAIQALALLLGLFGCGPIFRPETSEAESQGVANLESKLASLAAEARKVEDSLAVKRLQNAYAYYIEKGLWDQVVDLFTEDASIEFGNEGVYAGKGRIREYFRRLFRNRVGLAEGVLNAHLFVMPLITVAADGNTAHGRWKDIVMKGEFGKDAFWADGVYENEYRKENGIWKISKLHRYTNFIAPYDGGWVKSERRPDISNAAQDFPPDMPPTFDYEPFPGVFIPPYHPRLYVPEDNPLVHGVMLPGDSPAGSTP